MTIEFHNHGTPIGRVTIPVEDLEDAEVFTATASGIPFRQVAARAQQFGWGAAIEQGDMLVTGWL